MFLHEDSKICKYGRDCDRNYCMFKHEDNGDDKGENETFYCETQNTNSTFINPSKEMKITVKKALKCETCDFTTRRQSFIMEHKEEKHNWCSQCYSSVNRQKRLKNMLKNYIGTKVGL